MQQAEGQKPAVQPQGAERGVNLSEHCPVCSERLKARSCKLVCLVCGYYMSCSDYY